MSDHRLIAISLRDPKPVDRWGPYCTIPPVMKDGVIQYVHEVYPVARGWIRNDDGTTRPATDAELDLISRAYDAHLDRAFEFPK